MIITGEKLSGNEIEKICYILINDIYSFNFLFGRFFYSPGTVPALL